MQREGAASAAPFDFADELAAKVKTKASFFLRTESSYRTFIEGDLPWQRETMRPCGSN
jgi:hypothetical protein